MSNSDNTNSNNPDILQLEPNEALQRRNILNNFYYHKSTQHVNISLNHNCKPCSAAVKIDFNDFRKSVNQLDKTLDAYDIENDIILDIKNNIYDRYELIWESAKTYQEQQKQEQQEQDDDEDPVPELTIYKYSELGRGDLHEAVFVGRDPYFAKYDHESGNVEFIPLIHEIYRILRPPNLDQYPYKPFEFGSEYEFCLFIQKAKQIQSLDQLYSKCKSIFSKYIDHDDHVIVLLTADSIWTWFQDLFSTTHYLEGVGTNDVGKSSIGYTFEYTGYRVIKGIAISGANYNRVYGSIEPGQCVIIEDEGDSISEDPDKVRLFKAGYEFNAKIPKLNMNTRDQEQKWYKPYGHKMILAEKSLKEYKARGLVDRTFSFNCRPGRVKLKIKEVVSENLKKHPVLEKLYNELLTYRKLMLCYRLIHYKDQLPEIETGLTNRDNELCKPLLQLFYGTEALKEIVPALETFVRQRRTRRANSIEAALYPIIKQYVFNEVGLDYLRNNFEDLKAKKLKIKVGFHRIWNHIIDGGINGNYDEKKKYEYETIDYGTLYLNSLPTIISNKFTAEVKKQDYGSALIFDVEKLERFEDLYSNGQLDDSKIKIEVTPKHDDYDDYDDFDDFLEVRPSDSEYNNDATSTGEQEDNQ